jgi:hypothetical protein
MAKHTATRSPTEAPADEVVTLMLEADVLLLVVPMTVKPIAI